MHSLWYPSSNSTNLPYLSKPGCATFGFAAFHSPFMCEGGITSSLCPLSSKSDSTLGNLAIFFSEFHCRKKGAIGLKTGMTSGMSFL